MRYHLRSLMLLGALLSPQFSFADSATPVFVVSQALHPRIIEVSDLTVTMKSSRVARDENGQPTPFGSKALFLIEGKFGGQYGYFESLVLQQYDHDFGAYPVIKRKIRFFGLESRAPSIVFEDVGYTGGTSGRFQVPIEIKISGGSEKMTSQKYIFEIQNPKGLNESAATATLTIEYSNAKGWTYSLN